jgi:hypothetical protein
MLHRPHRFAFGHIDLNVIRKSLIFFGQVTKYFLRNRPYEALKRGVRQVVWYIHFIQPEKDKEKLGVGKP